MNQQEWNVTVDQLALDDLQKLGRGRLKSECAAVQCCYRMAFSEQPEDKHEAILRMAPNERWWVACMSR